MMGSLLGFEQFKRQVYFQLRPQDPCTNNEALIQVRTMQEEDLESKVDLPESEHEYEDTLDVIKLPSPIPTEVLAPHFLFVHPDEYALFKCFGKHNKCILTGNPGISKCVFSGSLFCFVFFKICWIYFRPLKKNK